VVVSVHMLGPGSDAAGYYLWKQANCPADYYLGAEAAGRWLGARRNVRLHMSGRAIGRRRLQQLGPADLNALYALLLAGDEEHRPLSPRSVAYVATILHRALRDAVRWHAIVRNPADAADPPRPSSKPEMNTWKAHELAQFLAGVGGDRLAGAWWLLATTGMRRGEVLGLRWQDVDLGMAWGTPKTGKGRRQVAVDPTPASSRPDSSAPTPSRSSSRAPPGAAGSRSPGTAQNIGPARPGPSQSHDRADAITGRGLPLP
jgi:integrase